jgi:hypothetical protein
VALTLILTVVYHQKKLVPYTETGHKVITTENQATVRPLHERRQQIN